MIVSAVLACGFYVTRKGGAGEVSVERDGGCGSGCGHLQDAVHIVATRLGCDRPMVETR